MSIENIVWISIAVAFALIGGFFIYQMAQYKCRLRVRKLTNGAKIVKDYRVKEFEDKDGVVWWRVAGEKRPTQRLISCPPEAAIDINDKGKKTAECYETETGDKIWIQDKAQVGVFPEELLDEKYHPKDIADMKDGKEKDAKIALWEKAQRKEWKDANKVVEAYKPLTTNQRLVLINNIRKAEARRGFDWKAQLIPVVALGSLVLVILGGLIFLPDVIKTVADKDTQATQFQAAQLETVKILKEIHTGQQRIEKDVADLQGVVGATAPD